MIDVADLASHGIYREHNPGLRTKDQRRMFRKALANKLCMPSVDARSTNRMLMRSHSLRGAVVMVLGRRIVTPPEAEASLKYLRALVEPRR